jgi:hypothetical protein
VPMRPATLLVLVIIVLAIVWLLARSRRRL